MRYKSFNQNKKINAIKVLVSGILVLGFLIVIGALIIEGVYAAVDTCPGNDDANQYTCAIADDFTNGTAGDQSDDVSCTDFNGSQFRKITCYPEDKYGPTHDNCDEDDSCGNSKDDPYTCLSGEMRACRDVTDADNGANCGSWYQKTGTDYRDITCYIDDDYGDWQSPSPYDPSDDKSIVSCSNGMCVKKDGSIITLPASPGLLCPVSFGCGGEFQCDSITHVCDEKNLICRSDSGVGSKLPGNEWTDTFRSLNGGAAYGYGTAVSFEGGKEYVYMTGEVLNAATETSGLDVFLRKYDDQGNLKWEKIYDNGGNESGYGVAVGGGGVFVTGRLDTNNGDMLLLNYAFDGAFGWGSSYDKGGVDIGKAIAVSGGTVFVAGSREDVGSNDIDAALWRYNAGDGSIIDTLIYDEGSHTHNEAANAVALHGSDIYVAGYSSQGNGDALILKYNASGSLVWAQRYYDASYTEIGNGVAVVDGSKKVFMTGFESSGSGDMFLISYSATSTNGDPFHKEDVSGSSGIFKIVQRAMRYEIGRGIIKEDHNARLYVVGSQQTSGEDVFLWASGLADPIVELYKDGKDNSSVERGFGLAVSGDIWRGAMYVTGYQDSNGGEAFLSKYSCNAPRQSTSISNAYFNITPAVIYSGALVTVNATKSGPGIASYDWNWGDSNTSSGVVSDHTYNTEGKYTITLTLDGKTTVPQEITVLRNHPPVASFAVDPAGGGAAPLVVTVSATSSDPDGVDTDPGDYIKSFTWEWGDGTADGHGEKTTHLYSSDGSYTIKLTVADSNGAIASASAIVNVAKQYVCGGGCPVTTPACWAKPDGSGNQCYECVPGTEYQCDSGMRCLGAVCKVGQKCANGNECPADGICPEAPACKAPSVCADTSYCPSSGRCPDKSCAPGEKTCVGGAVCPSSGICPAETCSPAGICPDGSACSNSGWCSNALKNTCVLGSETLLNQCYTEANGACASNADCNAGIQGGACDLNEKLESGADNPYYKQCKYAHCLNFTDNSCKTDKDCNNADGICDPNKKTCDYVYDCAYGPGMNSGATAATIALTPVMPPMPVGIQPDGQACTKPTADAPNNCEGINGCLYYNYYVEAVNNTGVPMPGDAGGNTIGNGVASCLNKFEGGTGCVYYGNQAASNSLVNCLPGTDFKKLKPKEAPAGISIDCVAFDKGNGKKEYDCTGVNGCYYYLNGAVDCDYVGGNGCVYVPNPAGGQMCPKTLKAPTSGKDFVQCLLNPDALLPAFLLGSGANNLSACRVNADCPAGQICLDGTCYPKCQNDKSCVTGESCVDTCETKADCQINCTVGTKCPSGADCVADNASPTGGSCPVVCNAGICQSCAQAGNCPVTGGFSCSDITTVHNLPYGAPSASISVSSSQNASCKWSLFDLPFANMSDSFSTGDSLIHTATTVGFPDAGPATIFTQCDDGAGRTAVCNIPLKIGTFCGGNNAACPSGMLCGDDGYCHAPECADAQPRGTLPFETLANGTTTSMATDKNSNCVRSNDYSQTNQCVAPILSCATAAPFTTTGGKTHSSFLSGASLVEGNNTQYAKCQETESSENKLSDTCRIPFNIGVCDPNSVINGCSKGWQCVGIGTGPGVCVPPACAGARPTGKLPYTTDNTAFGLSTNATSTCAYSSDYNDAYSVMVPFTETGGKAHSSNIPVTRNSDVYKYAKCVETATGDEAPVCTIHFKVGDLLPTCAGAHPTGRQDVGATPAIGLTTNQSAVCKFADAYDNSVTQEERYGNMINNLKSADGLTHGTDGVLQDVVTVVKGDNTKYVACRETAAPNKITECRIPFSGRSGPCTGALGECQFGSVCNPITKDCQNPCESSEPPEYCFTIDNPNPCQIMPDLPGCSSTPSFCSLHPDDPQCAGSCNTLGYEFHGSAIKPSGNCSLLAIILALISWIAWVVALLAVFSGLRAAYLYITSAGDEKKLRLAYQFLIYTTIGVGVAIVSFSLIAITRAILNI